MVRNVLCCALFFLAGFSAFCGTERNLLKNSEFFENDSSKIESWEIKSALPVKRNVIEAFQGLADSLFCLKGEGRTVIRQRNISIEPDTWYVLSLWYKNFSSDKIKSPYNLYLAAAKPGGGDWGAFAYHTFGACGEWSHVRLFYFSGQEKMADFLVMLFGGGAWEIGGVKFRQVKESDYYSNFVGDGDFEKGVMNSIPLDFRRTGKVSPDPRICENNGFPVGKKNMVAELSPEHPLDLVGPSFIAKENDIVKVSVWAKSDKPGVSFDLMAHCADLRKQCGVKLSSKWRKIELQTQLTSNHKKPLSGINKLRIYLKATACENSKIYIDRFEIKVIPPSKAALGAKKKNLILMNSSFESGLAGWEWMFFESAKDCRKSGKVSIDMETAAEGSCSLKIKVPKSDSEQSCHFLKLRSACFPAPSLETYTLSFWAKADRDDAMCNVGMFYGGGRKFALGREWKRYQVAIFPKRDKSGKNMVNFYFVLNGGRYWLDGVQLEKGDKATAYEPDGKIEVGGTFSDRIYPFFKFGEKVEADVYVCSRFDKEKEFDLSWTAVDYRQKIVGKFSRKVKIPPKKTVKFFIPLYSKGKGHFIVNFKAVDSGSGAFAESPLVYGVFGEPRKVDAEKSWFGILPCSLGAGRGGSTVSYLCLKGGTYDEQLKALRFMGFNWIRTFAPGDWANAEPEKGNFNWGYDDAIDAMRANGFKIFCMLGAFRDYPKWSDSGKAFENEIKHKIRNYPKVSDWEEYTKAFLDHYKSKIDVLTILSETGGYNVEEYFKLIKTLYPLIKKEVPGVRVAVPGYPCQGLPWNDDDNTWVGRLMKMGAYDYMDIYHGHFYLTGHAHSLAKVRKEPFESVITGLYGVRQEELAGQIKYFRKTYGDKPIWDTESGTIFTASVPWMEIPPEHLKYDWYTPEVSASRMVRWGIIKMALGIKKHMYFIFNLPFIYYHCLDIVNYNMSPRVGLPALSQFARRLDLAEFKGKTQIGLDTYVYVFSVEDKTVAVYWNFSMEDGKRGKLSLALPDENALIEDIMGNPLKPQKESSKVVLPLACSPVYIISKKLSPKEMLASFKTATVSGGKTCDLAVFLGNKDGKASVVAGLRSFSSETLKDLSLDLKLPEGWKTENSVIKIDSAAPLKITENSIPLTGFKSAPGSFLKVSSIIENKIYTAQSPELFMTKFPHARKEINLDGLNADEYSQTPSIEIDKDFQMQEKVKNPNARRQRWQALGKSVSAKIRCSWTQDTLYIFAEVKDDFLVKPKDERLFTGDSIEVYLNFEPRKSLFTKEYLDNCVKIVVSPGLEKGKAEFSFETMGHEAKEFKYIPLDKLKVVSRKTDKGYNIEMAIPVENITLNSGRILGFNFQLISFGKEKQDTFPMMWNGKTSWNNSRNFGFAVLDE